MRGKAFLCASSAVVAAFSAASAAPAAAAAVVGVMEGTGTINPALTLTPQAVFGGFSGNLYGAVDASGVTLAAGIPCDLATQSTGAGDTIAQGQGTISGGCGGVPVGSAYTRVGAVEVDTGSALAVCAWLPTSAPEIATYGKICGVA